MVMLVWFGFINMTLAAFNMIPGFPLDGGRVLRAIVWWLTGNQVRATRVAATLGQIVAVGFIIWLPVRAMAPIAISSRSTPSMFRRWRRQ
jgi:Zn-dependent protease